VAMPDSVGRMAAFTTMVAVIEDLPKPRHFC
jgi:hypothetical protein